MTKKESLKLFEQKHVRTVWDDEQEKWYFSIVDVVAVLTDSVNPTDYLKKLRKRDEQLGAYIGTNCPQVLMTTASGKKRKTLAADQEQLFRIIQSIPSPKAEPFKVWMAQVASERIDQMQDPELSIQQAMHDYKRLGYSDNWINQRLKSIEIRKELTDEWKRGEIKEKQYAILTDVLTKEWSGKTTKEYKHHKHLRKENLRDNMTNLELLFNSLAEASTTELAKNESPKGLDENAKVARRGGAIAKSARIKLEQQLGYSVVTAMNAKDYLNQIDNKNDEDDDRN